MATSAEVVEHLLSRMSEAGVVAAKKMFGEYGIYCDSKMVGVVCDNRLFIKPTEAGRALVGACEEESPYLGAKPSLLIEEDKWEDRAWLSLVVKATADALPMPKAKPISARKNSPKR